MLANSSTTNHDKQKSELIRELETVLKAAISSPHSASESISSEITQNVCNAIEAVFIHGLRDPFFLKGSRYAKYPEPNFWPFVQKFSHRSVINQIKDLKLIKTEIGKGRAWVRIMLNEGSLEHYMQMLLCDLKAVSQFYFEYALLLDHDLSEQMRGLLKGFSRLPINGATNNSFLNTWTPSPLILAGLVAGKALKVGALAPRRRPNSMNSDADEVGMSALDTIPEPAISPIRANRRGVRNTNHLLMGGVVPKDESSDDGSSVYSHPSMINKSIGGPPGTSSRRILSSTPKDTSPLLEMEASTANDAAAGTSKDPVPLAPLLVSRRTMGPRRSSRSSCSGSDSKESKSQSERASATASFAIGSYMSQGPEMRFTQSDRANDVEAAKGNSDTAQEVNPLRLPVSPAKKVDDDSELATNGQQTESTQAKQTCESGGVPSRTMVDDAGDDDVFVADDSAANAKSADRPGFQSGSLDDTFEPTVSATEEEQKVRALITPAAADSCGSGIGTSPDKEAMGGESASRDREDGGDGGADTVMPAGERTPTSRRRTRPLTMPMATRSETDQETDDHNDSAVFGSSLHDELLAALPPPLTPVGNSLSGRSGGWSQPRSICGDVDRDTGVALSSSSSSSGRIVSFDQALRSAAAKAADDDFSPTLEKNTEMEDDLASSSGVKDDMENEDPAAAEGRRRSLIKEDIFRKLTTIPREKGLDEQDLRCPMCRKSIGPTFSKYSLCHMDGQNYCPDCMKHGGEYPIPGRVVLSWDWRQRQVSDRGRAFLEANQDSPVLDMSVLNPNIYKQVKVMDNIRILRERLQIASMYLFNCRESIAEDFRRRITPRDHLYKDVHIYSFTDLLGARHGYLEKQLTNFVKFAIGHVMSCNLCWQKGFYCEICGTNEVIYPFNTDTTMRCSDCHGVFHTGCMTTECPRCVRRAAYAAQAASLDVRMPF